MNTFLLVVLLLGLLSYFTNYRQQQYLNVIVTKIIDGDSVVVNTETTSYTIRLAEIDAPEYDQLFGYEAKQTLYGLIFNKSVFIHIFEQDQYGRYIATILDDKGENINHALVKQGLAWVYRSYVKHDEILQYEEYARINKIGLWNLHAIPPWEWRKNKRKINT